MTSFRTWPKHTISKILPCTHFAGRSGLYWFVDLQLTWCRQRQCKHSVWSIDTSIQTFSWNWAKFTMLLSNGALCWGLFAFQETCFSEVLCFQIKRSVCIPHTLLITLAKCSNFQTNDTGKTPPRYTLVKEVSRVKAPFLALYVWGAQLFLLLLQSLLSSLGLNITTGPKSWGTYLGDKGTKITRVSSLSKVECDCKLWTFLLLTLDSLMVNILVPQWYRSYVYESRRLSRIVIHIRIPPTIIGLFHNGWICLKVLSPKRIAFKTSKPNPKMRKSQCFISKPIGRGFQGELSLDVQTDLNQ